MSASPRGRRTFGPWVRVAVLVILLGLVTYWLTVALCALGYTLVPEWVCKSTHLTAPS